MASQEPVLLTVRSGAEEPGKYKWLPTSHELVLLTVDTCICLRSGAEEPGNEVSLSVQMFSKLTSMVSLQKGNCLAKVKVLFLQSGL